eukprot:1149535-Pelagomonas_calceolata.AAC.7
MLAPWLFGFCARARAGSHQPTLHLYRAKHAHKSTCKRSQLLSLSNNNRAGMSVAGKSITFA